jgi:hypothetical protein
MTRQASPPWFHSTPALHISGRQRSLWGCCGSIRKSVTRRADVIESRGERARHRHRVVQEFCDRLSVYGDRTLSLFADGQAVEVPVF